MLLVITSKKNINFYNRVWPTCSVRSLSSVTTSKIVGLNRIYKILSQSQSKYDCDFAYISTNIIYYLFLSFTEQLTICLGQRGFY